MASVTARPPSICPTFAAVSLPARPTWAVRITAYSVPLAALTLGGLGGSQTITINQAGATAMDGPNEAAPADAGSPTANFASINHEHNIHITHNRIQPTMILNYLIRI